LLETFPIWMVNLADIASVVPFSRELFDLAILDEATQCDMASCLPVLQRAKRAVIVGDPHQLRHVSFLSRNRQRRAAERAGLDGSPAEEYDYRDKSILDLASERIVEQSQVTLLDEHFRSVPPIIDFSNREFYRGHLKVMQERPGADFRGSLEYVFVGGRRDRSGANHEEAEILVGAVVAHVEEGERHPEGMRHSIGILSPFSAQVELLTKLLASRLSTAQVEAHELLIGSPFAFQGEERDVMFLSLAVDPNSHPASFRFLNRSDVFNVSITRARSRQRIYGSIDARDPKVKGLLGRYLEHVTRTAAQPRAGELAQAANDDFQQEVRAVLEQERFTVWPAYPVAGFRVDLVAERDGRLLGIDLVGHPGVYAGSFEIERYRLWNRAGLRILPLPYSAWRRDRRECLRAIENAFAAQTDETRGR
jgi:superfamily I DNA and/or RNA helicase